MKQIFSITDMSQNVIASKFYLAITGKHYMWIRTQDTSVNKAGVWERSRAWTGVPILDPADTILNNYSTLQECVDSYLKMSFPTQVYEFDNLFEMVDFIRSKVYV